MCNNNHFQFVRLEELIRKVYGSEYDDVARNELNTDMLGSNPLIAAKRLYEYCAVDGIIDIIKKYEPLLIAGKEFLYDYDTLKDYVDNLYGLVNEYMKKNNE